MYESRTRVVGLRIRSPGLLEEHDLVRTAGIEPAISGMSRRHSPAELRAHLRPDQRMVEPSVGIEPTPAAYEAATRPSCYEGKMVERTAGFEPAWTSSGTKRRTQRPRPHRASGWT